MAIKHDPVLKRDGALQSPWQSGVAALYLKTDTSPETVYDALVIGGGLTGLTTALLLQNAGRKVIIAEASEPEHLGTLVHLLMPSMSKKGSQAAGWGAHYAVGLLFVLAYQELWKSGPIKRNLANAMILGTLRGAVALLVWKATMKSHPAPPWIDLTKFYVQLVPAHIVFAVCATLTSRLLDKGIQQA